MRTYLLTVAAVIFLSVMVSLLIPEGKLNKSVIFVMRMACILVLIQPVTGIFKISSSSANAPMYDYVYISNVYSKNQSKQLEKLLFEKFSTECNCFVEIVYDNGNFKAESVTVEVESESEQIIYEIYAYLQELKYINISVYAKGY